MNDKNYKYREWMHPGHPGPNNIFVYKRTKGPSWFKLMLAAIIGVYVGQTYDIPKIEGPFKMYARFKEYLNERKIKDASIKDTQITTQSNEVVDKWIKWKKLFFFIAIKIFYLFIIWLFLHEM